MPAVERPLRTGDFAAAPCDLLGARERDALGLTTATLNAEVGSPACDFVVGGSTEFLKIKVSGDIAGAVASCGTSASARCDLWRMTKVGGYPVLLANSDWESRYGSCKLFIAVSDTESVMVADVRTTLGDGPDCARAEQTAAMVIAALD